MVPHLWICDGHGVQQREDGRRRRWGRWRRWGGRRRGRRRCWGRGRRWERRRRWEERRWSVVGRTVRLWRCELLGRPGVLPRSDRRPGRSPRGQRRRPVWSNAHRFLRALRRVHGPRLHLRSQGRGILLWRLQRRGRRRNPRDLRDNLSVRQPDAELLGSAGYRVGPIIGSAPSAQVALLQVSWFCRNDTRRGRSTMVTQPDVLGELGPS